MSQFLLCSTVIAAVIKSSNSFKQSIRYANRSNMYSTVGDNNGQYMHSKNILVLGGTGFVGLRFINAAKKSGNKLVSISRRGKPDNCVADDSITWISGDATNYQVLADIHRKYGPFNAYVHAIGLLLDVESGLASLNEYASGSKSVPGQDSTYDKITRQTAFQLVDLINSDINVDKSAAKPFVFISAAEAGWTFKAPFFVPWLEKYLVAKRSVEKRLLESKSTIRPVIFRPSLIWTWERPQALVSVFPFYIGSKFLPFVDRPVLVDTLVAAMLTAIEDSTVSGINRCIEIELLATKQMKSNTK